MREHLYSTVVPIPFALLQMAGHVAAQAELTQAAGLV